MEPDWKKKYEEVLSLAKSYYGKGQNEFLDTLFPELAENEDERIRKELIDFVNHYRHNTDLTSEQAEWCKKALAYLEKQKEQKPSKTEPIVDGLTEFEKQVSYLIASVIDKEHKYSEGYVKWVAQSLMGHAIKNQKPVEWSKEDKTMLNNLIWSVHMKSISPPLDEMDDRGKYEKYEKFLASIPERFSLQPKQGWNEGERKILESIIDDYEKAAKSFCGYDGKIRVLKAIRDGEYDLSKREWSDEDELMRTAVIQTLETFKGRGTTGMQIDWLKSLHPQLKQEWSEEDEKMLVGIIERGSAQIPPFEPALRGEQMEWLMNRLKSLRPSWKPSEEQIDALDDAIFFDRTVFRRKKLVSLLEDLKKLM